MRKQLLKARQKGGKEEVPEPIKKPVKVKNEKKSPE